MAHRPRLEGGTQPILPPMGRPIPGTMRMTQPDVYTKNWTLPFAGILHFVQYDTAKKRPV
jgi:hypothetical protein